MCYDKVTLWVNRRFIRHDMDKLANRINVGKVSEDIKTGVVTMVGTMKGMSLYIKPNGLSIVGSLPKFLYDDNIHPLTRKTTGKAIAAICRSPRASPRRSTTSGPSSKADSPLTPRGNLRCNARMCEF